VQNAVVPERWDQQHFSTWTITPFVVAPATNNEPTCVTKDSVSVLGTVQVDIRLVVSLSYYADIYYPNYSQNIYKTSVLFLCGLGLRA
jgi:hypothetical protein